MGVRYGLNRAGNRGHRVAEKGRNTRRVAACPTSTDRARWSCDRITTASSSIPHGTRPRALGRSGSTRGITLHDDRHERKDAWHEAEDARTEQAAVRDEAHGGGHERDAVRHEARAGRREGGPVRDEAHDRRHERDLMRDEARAGRHERDAVRDQARAGRHERDPVRHGRRADRHGRAGKRAGCEWCRPGRTAPRASHTERSESFFRPSNSAQRHGFLRRRALRAHPPARNRHFERGTWGWRQGNEEVSKAHPPAVLCSERAAMVARCAFREGWRRRSPGPTHRPLLATPPSARTTAPRRARSRR